MVCRLEGSNDTLLWELLKILVGTVECFTRLKERKNEHRVVSPGRNNDILMT